MFLVASAPFHVRRPHPGAIVLLALCTALLAGFILATGHAPPSTVIHAVAPK